MSSTTHAEGHAENAHGSYKSYLTGFALSVVLTIIPFWIVIGEVEIGLPLALTIIFGMGTVQILVHIHYFLHVSLGNEGGWQMLSMIFTAIVVFIVMVGSIWVMFHLHENMMPDHELIERVRNLP